MTDLALRERRTNVTLFMTGEVTRELQPQIGRFIKPDGSQVVQILGMPVFRSGTFRDSMGEQSTWEELHISEMVNHFTMLRDRKLFADVPVETGILGFSTLGSSLEPGRVVGYHTALRSEKHTSSHDNKEYTFLVADYEILDHRAQEQIESGLWRNRSAEVGWWSTNDEAEFWPVYRGMAYVDIPAVEGLNSFQGSQS